MRALDYLIVVVENGRGIYAMQVPAHLNIVPNAHSGKVNPQ